MSTPVIHPKFHHFNLKTTRLQEMIDWYSTLVGAEVLFQDAVGAWLTNDEANHRIALLAFPDRVHDQQDHTQHAGRDAHPCDQFIAGDDRRDQGREPDHRQHQRNDQHRSTSAAASVTPG